VVAVEVRYKKRRHIEAGAEPHHLSLCALATVEQQPVALAIDKDGTRSPVGRWNGPAGAEKGHT
jgi:hypothetical protein